MPIELSIFLHLFIILQSFAFIFAALIDGTHETKTVIWFRTTLKENPRTLSVSKKDH